MVSERRAVPLTGTRVSMGTATEGDMYAYEIRLHDNYNRMALVAKAMVALETHFAAAVIGTGAMRERVAGTVVLRVALPEADERAVHFIVKAAVKAFCDALPTTEFGPCVLHEVKALGLVHVPEEVEEPVAPFVPLPTEPEEPEDLVAAFEPEPVVEAPSSAAEAPDPPKKPVEVVVKTPKAAEKKKGGWLSGGKRA